LTPKKKNAALVARELHDGISQILVGVHYVLENARRRLEQGDTKAARKAPAPTF
jgi:signal transduction histidine kinase